MVLSTKVVQVILVRTEEAGKKYNTYYTAEGVALVTITDDRLLELLQEAQTNPNK